jgi:hypothetical protein
MTEQQWYDVLLAAFEADIDFANMVETFLFDDGFVTSNTTASEDGEIVVFLSTGGQSIQRSSINITALTTGWLPAAETWTRTGNLTFTLTGDVTAKYRKGTKVRYKDGGSYEYGTIGSSVFGSVTTVTLIDNTDYAMAAATITDRYISYAENPEVFPHYFNWNANPQGFSAVPTSQTYRWHTKGRTIFCEYVELANGTSNATTFTASGPIAPLQGVATVAGTLVNNGALLTTAGRMTMSAGSTAIAFRTDMASGAWTNANGKRALAYWFYEY